MTYGGDPVKLTGCSDLTIKALQEVMGDHVGDATVTTILMTGGTPLELLHLLQERMAKLDDHRHHPYASLHSAVRRLRKAAEAQGGPEAPADAPVVTEGQEEATTMPPREYDVEDDGSLTPVDESDHPEAVKLQQEIARFQLEHDKLEATLPSLQAEYDKAWAKERKYEDTTIPEKVKQECDRLSARLVSVLEQQKSLRLTINRLSNPAELARRIQDSSATTERIKTMADKAPKKQTAREMGVPSAYLSESGNYKPGMDARHKSDLIARILGTDESKSLLPKSVTKEQALEMLQARNWVGFLTRKREILEAKAAAKATKAASKPAAKKASTKASSTGDEVKSDPKPKPTAKRRGGRLQSKAGATS